MASARQHVILLGLVALLACSPAAAQAVVETQVFDALSGGQLPGVKIELANGADTLTRLVGAGGRDRWPDLRPGTYTLRASMSGFKTHERAVELVAGQNDLRIELEPFRVVSIIRLIGAPGKYDGLPVVVEGFCSAEFEDTALYLHEEDWHHRLGSNSVRLDAATSVLNEKHHKRYVTVFGVFSSPPPGGLDSGKLHSIETIVINERR